MKPWLTYFVKWLFLVCLWFLFVYTFSVYEFLAGAAAAAVAVVGLEFTLRSAPMKFQPRLRWILQAWRLPRAIAGGIRDLLEMLLRKLQKKPSQSLFQLVNVNARGDDARSGARRTLMILFSTIPPTSFVVGIDADKNYLLFHLIKPVPVPELIRKLES